MWLTPDAEGGYVSRPLHIPEELLPHVSGALLELTHAYRWEAFGNLTPDQCAALALAMMEIYYKGNPMIGTVIPYANFQPPDNMLACDGSVYLRADYPDLYAVLANAYLDDADHFHTPNLVSRFVMGDATNTGAQGGEATVVLTTQQMPNHLHVDAGHAHFEKAAIGTIINGGLEAPADSAFDIVVETQLGQADIQPTGGGEAHNNLPPYHGLRFGIIWR